jgi:hypothetical protein
MRENAERGAWAVLLTSFAVFCLLAVSIPLGIRYYVRNAERERVAIVESLVGTVVVELPVGSGPQPLTRGNSLVVPEGTLIYVDETSEAVVTFFDHSFMRLFSGAAVRLERLRSPRFQASSLPTAVHLSLFAGRIRIGTALSTTTPLDMLVSTLYGQARLAEDGSYAVEVGQDRAEIIAYRGHADVRAQNQEMRIEPRERTQIAAGQPPELPVGVARNLIANGEFEQPLTEWRIFNDQGTDGGDVDGIAELVVDEGRQAVRLYRTGAGGDHCETILEQTIDAVIPDPATSLVVRATVKVRYQALSGGGYLASEYPLMIRITYRDVYDSEAEWVQGFYYQNIQNNPTTFGLQIPQDRWYLYESDNLLETLSVSPYRIIRIRVYASGWDYESLISDINLIVE